VQPARFQDVGVHAAVLAPGDKVTPAPAPGAPRIGSGGARRGRPERSTARTDAGAAVSGELDLALVAKTPAEILLFDLV
jgi:hypothetical protein